MVSKKKKLKLQARLGKLGKINGWGACWICKSTSGVKVGRNSYVPICKRCRQKNLSTKDANEYKAIKMSLKVN